MMSRFSKRKLAIVAGISECLVYADAKYCPFEIPGDSKYYACQRYEYCCNFGCCVSPGFQMYHLWYYWLLIIIMFLVCSGGGWWYRYWLQSRYRAAASAIPSRRGAGSTRGQNAHRGPSCPAQQASITYNSARNTVLLHRMWKTGSHHRGTTSSPAYTGPPVASAATSTHFQNTSVVLNDVNCPYYQLYGPPPSYETVIAQTRGKTTSPLSPERTRTTESSPGTGSSNVQTQEHVTRCYNNSGMNRYEQNSATIVEPSATIHQQEAIETATSSFPRYPPPYSLYASSSTGTTPVHSLGRQETCLPLDFHPGGSIIPMDFRPGASRSFDLSGNLTLLKPCLLRRVRWEGFPPNQANQSEIKQSHNGERNVASSADPQRRKSNATVPSGCVTREKQQQIDKCNSKESTGESHSSVPDLQIDKDLGERYSRNHGGSLKFSRTRDDPQTSIMTQTNFQRSRTFIDVAPLTGRRENLNDGESTLENGASASFLPGNLAKSVGNNETRIGNQFRISSGSNASTEQDFCDSEEHGALPRSSRSGLLSGDSSRITGRRYGNNQKQTNPSDNVILEPMTSVRFETATVATTRDLREDMPSERLTSGGITSHPREHDDIQRPRFLLSPEARSHLNDELATSNNNHESTHIKLDRSRSLD